MDHSSLQPLLSDKSLRQNKGTGNNMMIRSLSNPVISRKDIPATVPELVDVSSVFNPGAVKHDNLIKLMLRVQNRGRETFLLMADSEDGRSFQIRDEIIKWHGIEKVKEKIYHLYDPRITKIDTEYYIMFSLDMESGCRLGLGKTMDFAKFEFMGIVSDHDNRNGVLFPEKINNKFLRLDRPNLIEMDSGLKSGNAICLAESLDLLHWKSCGTVAEGRAHYWDELIGAGPPPIKTRQGWLVVYHGIALHYQPIYQAGVMLLDLQDPLKVIGRSRVNILEPREIYELVGQVPNVVFPSGAICSSQDDEGFVTSESEILIYYGAADTSVCRAETDLRILMAGLTSE
ncbi:MAG: glycoside hydrolase family 130 protein [Candidatus Cloacimonetes bacterium]|nr:glycoside hydrolase family 130 protein [Candidatus Cloacimonadota bacterium]